MLDPDWELVVGEVLIACAVCLMVKARDAEFDIHLVHPWSLKIRTLV